MAFTFPHVTPANTGCGWRGYAHPDGKPSALSGTVYHPSVTEILTCTAKPALVRWSANVERDLWRQAAIDLHADTAGTVTLSPIAYADTLDRRVGQLRAYQREQQAALDIGSAAHKLVEYEIRKGLGQTVGRAPEVPPKSLWAVMAVQDWFLAHQVKPLFVECQVFGGLGYAGTFDLLAKVDGQVALIDWKVSKALYPEHDVQAAAYAQALEDMGHPAPAQVFVIRLPKEETETAVEVHEVADWRQHVPTFAAICAVWKWWRAADAQSKAAWQAKKERVA